MIDPKQIPDEVVEAAARREHDMDFEAWGSRGCPAWGILSDAMRAWRMKRCRAAIAAALNAWPDAVVRDAMSGLFQNLILPLPKDAADE